MTEKGINPAFAFSSRMRRTVDTAFSTLGAMGLTDMTLEIRDALNEMSLGEYEGRLKASIYTPDVKDQIARKGKDFKLPGTESMNDVGTRVLNWANTELLMLAEETGGRPIVAFSHNTAIRCLAATIEGWPHDLVLATNIDNATLNEFTMQSNGDWRVGALSQGPR